MQCKDIPDEPILAFLAQHKGHPVSAYADSDGPSIREAMPPGVPDKLAFTKMRGLINRGLVEGCACGCWGGFTLAEEQG